MDFGWMPYFTGFWIFPVLCLAFMAVMMLACGGMWSRFGPHARGGNGRDTAREILERRYASGEIGKEQYEAMRRDLNA